MDPPARTFLLVLHGLASVALSASAQSTFNNTDKSAWGANAGWISFRHDQPASPAGVVFGESFLSGLAYSANLGWINFGTGAPANRHTYSNSGSDHGVNHDGSGNLSGFAWSANTGWINFGWATATDPNRPRVDLLTGTFYGYAYSANTGWVQLGSGRLVTQSMSCPDSDNDGLADHWEQRTFGNLTAADAASDRDGDGVTDLGEYHAGTDANNQSSYLRIVFHAYTTGRTEATLEFTTTPARLYRIEYADGLGDGGPWANSALGTFAPSAGTTTSRVITFPTHIRKFFRVVAVRPLSP